MSNATYEDVLEAARHLTPDEQRELRKELAQISNGTTDAFLRFLETAEPIRPEALAAMERAIEEDTETIEP